MSKKDFNFKKQSLKTVAAQAKKFEAKAYTAREDEIAFEHCVIIKVNPGCKFIAQTEQNTLIKCELSGNMRRNNIRVMENDKVTIVTSPYDLTRGRIVVREKL